MDFNIKLSLKASLMAACGIVPTAAWTQTPTPVGTAAEQASNATSTVGLVDDIVVTAQRRSESLARTPVAVAVLTAETLEKRQIVTESDLQLSSPGLTVRASQNSNQLNYSLRGQTVDAFSGSLPGVLPYFNEVQVGGSGSSAFYDLQSVQVLKGPQGTLFGRNATGGAVLFTSTKPQDEFGGYIVGRIGNYDHQQIEGALNVPLSGERLVARIAGIYQHRDGFQTNLLDGSKPGTIDRYGLRGSLRAKLSDSITNDLVVDYAHSGGISTQPIIANTPAGTTPVLPAAVLYSPALDVILGAPGFFANYVATHPGTTLTGFGGFGAIQKQMGPYKVYTSFSPKHDSRTVVISNITALDVTDNVQIKNIFGYVDSKSHDLSDNDASPYGLHGEGGTPAIDIRTKQVSNEFQVLGKAFENDLSYVAGVYFSKQKLESLFSTQILIDLPIGQTANNYAVSRNKSIAGYAQGTYNLGGITGIEGLGITAGVRFTHEDVDQERLPGDTTFANPSLPTLKVDKLSWQFGLQEQVNPNLLLYVTSRRSFRSGGYVSSAPALPGLADVGGAAFAPEVATDVELGLKHQGNIAGIPTRLNVAAYNLWVKDAQRVVYGFVAGNLASLTANVPHVKIKGVEVDGQVRPASWLTLGGSINYTDAKFGNDPVVVLGGLSGPVVFGPYPDTPKWSGSLYGEISAPVSSSLTASFRSDLFAQTSTHTSSTGNTLTPGDTVPGYAVVDFRLGIENSTAGWSLSANLKNAFNRTYYVGGISYANLYGTNDLIPGDRRTILVEARYKF